MCKNKVSSAQMRFLKNFDTKSMPIVRRTQKDGTIMPYQSEMRSIDKLIEKGLLKWVEAGKDGYSYNGVVPTEAGAEFISSTKFD